MKFETYIKIDGIWRSRGVMDAIDMHTAAKHTSRFARRHTVGVKLAGTDDKIKQFNINVIDDKEAAPCN